MSYKPAFQFYPGDWKKDPCLSMCEPATRGIYIDILCSMHDNDGSGLVEGTVQQLARMCRCSPDEMGSAIDELSVTKTCRVTESDTIITLINKRMNDEHMSRQSSAERSKRYRENRKSDVKVTPLSSSSSSSSTSSSTSIPEKSVKKLGVEISKSFDRFWVAYPKKRDKKKSLDVWSRIKPDEDMLNKIIKHVTVMKMSEDWTKENGQYIPLPTTYLRGERWNDETVPNAQRVNDRWESRSQAKEEDQIPW